MCRTGRDGIRPGIPGPGLRQGGHPHEDLGRPVPAEQPLHLRDSAGRPVAVGERQRPQHGLGDRAHRQGHTEAAAMPAIGCALRGRRPRGQGGRSADSDGGAQEHPPARRCRTGMLAPHIPPRVAMSTCWRDACTPKGVHVPRTRVRWRRLADGCLRPPAYAGRCRPHLGFIPPSPLSETRPAQSSPPRSSTDSLRPPMARSRRSGRDRIIELRGWSLRSSGTAGTPVAQVGAT
jgi:hypothetical protein